METVIKSLDDARTALGEFNDKTQSLDVCIKEMALQLERLRKTVIEANEEIATTKDLVSRQSNVIMGHIKETKQKEAHDKLTKAIEAGKKPHAYTPARTTD